MIVLALTNTSGAAGMLLNKTGNRFFLQTADTVSGSDFHLLTIFVGIAAFSLLFLVLVIIGVAIAAAIVAKKVGAEVNVVKMKAMPIIGKSQALIEQSRGLLTDLTPEIKKITTQVHGIIGHGERIAGQAEQIAVMAKDQVKGFEPTISAAKETFSQANDTVREVNHKTQQQVQRVNGMVSTTLDATVEMGKSLRHGITQPGREIAGIVSGVKAGFRTLFKQKSSASFSRRQTVPTYPSPPYRAADKKDDTEF